MKTTTQNHHPFLPWIMFIALAMIWGSSFILMKRGLGSFTYSQVGTLRVSIAAIFMSIVGIRHFKYFMRKDLFPLIIVGFLGNAIPYVLFPLAVNHLDSAVVGITNSLVPLFTVLVGGWFFGQRATGLQWRGVAVGLMGAVILILPVQSILNGGFQLAWLWSFWCACHYDVWNFSQYLKDEASTSEGCYGDNIESSNSSTIHHYL